MLEPKTPTKGITIAPKQTLTASERVWIICTVIGFINLVISIWTLALDLTPWWLLLINLLILTMVSISKPHR